MDTVVELNEEKIEKAAVLLKCIAHPVRIKILLYIAKNKEVSVNEICKHADCEQSLTSHHLLNMKSKNILVSKVVGKQRIYSVKNDKVLKMLSCIEANY